MIKVNFGAALFFFLFFFPYFPFLFLHYLSISLFHFSSSSYSPLEYIEVVRREIKEERRSEKYDEGCFLRCAST